MTKDKTEELTTTEPTNYPYPTKPPINEALALLAIFRQGKITDNIPLILKNLHILWGYGLNLFVGEPPADGSPSGPIATPDVQFLIAQPTVLIPEFVEALQTFVDNHTSDVARPVFQAEIVDRREALKVLKDIPWDKIFTFIVQYGPSLIPLLIKK